jgi:hypothetical protein
VTKKPVKRRRYAEGGKVEPEKPGLFSRMLSTPKTPAPQPKYPVGVGSGLNETIKRRQDRMDAVERGDPDPGQKPDEKLARGGRVKAKARRK